MEQGLQSQLATVCADGYYFKYPYCGIHLKEWEVWKILALSVPNFVWTG
jgi:hypothetical protein